MKEKNDNWFSESKIKNHSTNEIEETISKSLSALVGEEIEANVKFIDYNPYKQNVNTGKCTEIHIIISHPEEGTVL